MWCTGLFAVPVIGGAIGWFFLIPMNFWFGYRFIYIFPLSRKEKESSKSLCIDWAVVRKALK